MLIILPNLKHSFISPVPVPVPDSGSGFGSGSGFPGFPYARGGLIYLYDENTNSKQLYPPV